jgi:hypothetical protein
VVAAVELSKLCGLRRQCGAAAGCLAGSRRSSPQSRNKSEFGSHSAATPATSSNRHSFKVAVVAGAAFTAKVW